MVGGLDMAIITRFGTPNKSYNIYCDSMGWNNIMRYEWEDLASLQQPTQTETVKTK